MKQFQAREPVLWFQTIGQSESDAPFGIQETCNPVYQTVLSRTGANFILDEHGFFHLDDDFNLIHGSLFPSLKTGEIVVDNSREIEKMIAAGVLVQLPPIPTLSQERKIPDKVFDTLHHNVLRVEVSEAFSQIMDATEELRSYCQQDGGWVVLYNDYGNRRTVSMSLTDVETMVSAFILEYDPLTNRTTINISDQERERQILEAVRKTGATVNDKSPFTIEDWNSQRLITFQDFIKDIYLVGPASQQHMHRSPAMA